MAISTAGLERNPLLRPVVVEGPEEFVGQPKIHRLGQMEDERHPGADPGGAGRRQGTAGRLPGHHAGVDQIHQGSG